MKSFKSQEILYAFIGAIVLAGCSQSGQIASKTSPVVLASVNEDGTPAPIADQVVAAVAEEEDDAEEVDSREGCFKFSTSKAIDLAAIDDLNLADVAGNFDITQSVRNLSIENSKGNISISSSINSNINGMMGNLYLNSLNVLKVDNVKGNICVKAKSIGEISNGFGNTHVIAETIESVIVQTGNFHIYGAKVKKAKTLTGNICLHEGAVILDVSEVTGHIRSDCK